jgi:hypothetical protein
MNGADRLLAAWRTPTVARCARALVLAGAAALFLQSAATADVVFTVRISYVLLMGALVLGAPWAWSGWRALPWWLAVAAAALLLVYLLATLFGDEAALAAGRSGRSRSLVYLGDLALGLGVLGLVRGLWEDDEGRRPLIAALALGGIAAGAYALYQWPAQHFGLPLHDVVTTGDSNGVTSGGSQGNGVLGWERVRGTFLEPHFLGTFLASMLPLVVAWGLAGSRRTLQLATAGAAVMLVALLLTASVPSWFCFGLAALIAAALAATARGHVRAAVACACVAAVACVMAPLTLARPEAAAALTHRSADSMAVTTRFRTEAWSQAVDVWATRPVLGFGAGQSSVRLALATDGTGAAALPSAQGLWAASLVDVGVLGFAAWSVVILGILALVTRAAWRRPSAEALLIFASVLASCLSTAVAGDRMELRVWVVLALGLALACRRRRASAPLGELRLAPDRLAVARLRH